MNDWEKLRKNMSIKEASYDFKEMIISILSFDRLTMDELYSQMEFSNQK